MAYEKVARSRGLDNTRRGGTGRATDWLPKNKTGAFIKLYESIKTEIGGSHKARDYVGLGSSTVNDMNNGRISAETGKKILEAHNRLFK